MRVIIQRVSEASVTVNQVILSKIQKGYLILLGIEATDTAADIQWLCKKIASLRIFGDEQGLMNLSIKEVQGEILIVSQFTLYASTKKGNRPSFIKAAKPDIAIPLYEAFVAQLKIVSECNVYTGAFGADMKVALLNDGPVTILIDSKLRD